MIKLALYFCDKNFALGRSGYEFIDDNETVFQTRTTDLMSFSVKRSNHYKYL